MTDRVIDIDFRESQLLLGEIFLVVTSTDIFKIGFPV